MAEQPSFHCFVRKEPHRDHDVAEVQGRGFDADLDLVGSGFAPFALAENDIVKDAVFADRGLIRGIFCINPTFGPFCDLFGRKPFQTVDVTLSTSEGHLLDMFLSEELLEQFVHLLLLDGVAEVYQGRWIVREFVQDHTGHPSFSFLLEVGEFRSFVHGLRTSEKDPKGGIFLQGHLVQLPHDVQQHHRALLFRLYQTFGIDVLAFLIQPPGEDDPFEGPSFSQLLDGAIRSFLSLRVGDPFFFRKLFEFFAFADSQYIFVPLLQFLDELLGFPFIIREHQPIRFAPFLLVVLAKLGEVELFRTG